MTEARPISFEFTTRPLADLKPHEEFVEGRVRDVVGALDRTGVLPLPVVVDRATGVILDGHHRHEALRRLGCARVPVAVVDYDDPRIVVESWRKGETPPTKAEVVAHALAGKRFPPKTTRHRVLNSVPEWPARLADLR